MALLLALFPHGSVGVPAAPGASIPVSITSSANPVDAGFPFELLANVPGSADQYFYNWTDSEGGSDSAATWELELDEPGNVTVTLHVTDPEGDSGETTLGVVVRPPLAVTLYAPLPTVDAGVPAPFFIQVTGGVPPVTASWVTSPGGTNGSAGWPTDGTFTEMMDFSTPGPAWILAQAADSLGDSSSTAELLAEVVPTGSIELATNGSVGEVGFEEGVEAIVENGAPPFRWSLSSSPVMATGTTPFGTFPTDGIYPWNLTFAAPGETYLNLTSVDALGAVATASAAVLVEPALGINLTAVSALSSPPFVVDATIVGGVPPYEYRLTFSDGEGSDGSLSLPGTIRGTLDPTHDGNYSVECRVTDALGASRSTELFLVVPAITYSPPSGSSNGLPIDGGVTALAGALLVTGFFLYRRRRKTPDSDTRSAGSALPTVRRVLEQSQVIDRETAVLLAEEAGESVDAAQTAIQTLIQTGEVTTEPGPGEVEILRWKGVNPLEEPRAEAA